MIELTPARCFIVRVYRLDPEAPDKITGQVEVMDGSGVRTPFTGMGELVETLRQHAGKPVPSQGKSGGNSKQRTPVAGKKKECQEKLP
jgi:hypothetical protein